MPRAAVPQGRKQVPAEAVQHCRQHCRKSALWHRMTTLFVQNNILEMKFRPPQAPPRFRSSGASHFWYLAGLHISSPSGFLQNHGCSLEENSGSLLWCQKGPAHTIPLYLGVRFHRKHCASPRQNMPFSLLWNTTKPLVCQNHFQHVHLAHGVPALLPVLAEYLPTCHAGRVLVRCRWATENSYSIPVHRAQHTVKHVLLVQRGEKHEENCAVISL